MEQGVWIVALKGYKDYEKGKKYLVDTDEAADLVDAGRAEKCGDPADEAIEKAVKAIEAKQNEFMQKIGDVLAKPIEVKMPAMARDHAAERGSLGEFACAVGKMSHKYEDAAEKEKAANLLTNKYKQDHRINDKKSDGYLLPQHMNAKFLANNKSNLNQTTNASGGYLVPEYWDQNLIYQAGYESVPFPDKVTVFPMQGHYLHLPTLDQTVTPNGSGQSAFYGGTVVQVVAEGTAPSATTQPAFKTTQLTAKKFMAYTQATKELLDNSPISVEPLLQMNLSGATRAEINNRIFNGSGGSSDLTGVINAGATLSETRQTAGQINLRDVARMFSRLAPGSRKRAKWVCNPWALESLFQMSDKSGRAVYLQGFQSAHDEPQSTIFGLEVLTSEALPTLGNTGDIILFDPGAYAVGLNQNIYLATSDQFAFTSEIITYRITVRCDGNLLLTAPIYLMDGVSQVSPFVQLSTTVGS